LTVFSLGLLKVRFIPFSASTVVEFRGLVLVVSLAEVLYLF